MEQTFSLGADVLMKLDTMITSITVWEPLIWGVLVWAGKSVKRQ